MHADSENDTPPGTSGGPAAGRRFDLAYALAALVLGLFLLFVEVPDHGRTMDDSVQEIRGRSTWRYLTTLDPDALPSGDLEDYRRGDPLYGPLGVTAAVALGSLIGPWIGDPEQARYLEFHAGLALWFVVLFVCVCALGRRWTGSGWGGALAGCGLLAQPRIWGLATVSPSDLPAAAALALAVLLLWRWFDRPKWGRAVPLAAAIGAVLAVRPQNGVVLVPVMLAFLAPRLFAGLRSARGTSGGALGSGGPEPLPWAQLLAAPLLCYVFWVAFWPDFWHRPLAGPWTVIRSFANDKTAHYAVEIFWFGKSVKAPPEYPFVMLGLTTPLLVLAAAAIGWIAMLGSRRNLGLGFGLVVWFCLSTGKHLSGYGNNGGVRHFLDAYVPLTLWAASGGLASARFAFTRVARLGPRGERLAPRVALALGLLSIPFARAAHPYESSHYNRLIGGVEGASGRLNLDPDGTVMLPLMQELLPLLEPDDVILFVGIASLVDQVRLPPGVILYSARPLTIGPLLWPESREQLAQHRVWIVQPNHPTLFDAAFANGSLRKVVVVGPAGIPVALASLVEDQSFYDELAKLAR